MANNDNEERNDIRLSMFFTESSMPINDLGTSAGESVQLSDNITLSGLNFNCTGAKGP